ncbi:endonuclease VII domain-containing protein [Arthrobacter sp. Sa2BUA2]|uniref:Endonuclease VII domain-containing protein n=2 Tax=Arthrobacter pullicola TaxID=2762224 RepID=A0ABR8YF45_9MICC|nr:endonuclease VII domain-containing protein [Arthrobacter pullicola]
MRAFGLSAKQFKEMIASQGNACAICRRAFDGIVNKVCVDHDHACCPGVRTCGECIRGLLCNNCNSSLGWFKDSVEAIVAAIGYLETWNDSRLLIPAHPRGPGEARSTLPRPSERISVVGTE